MVSSRMGRGQKRAMQTYTFVSIYILFCICVVCILSLVSQHYAVAVVVAVVFHLKMLLCFFSLSFPTFCLPTQFLFFFCSFFTHYRQTYADILLPFLFHGASIFHSHWIWILFASQDKWFVSVSQFNIKHFRSLFHRSHIFSFAPPSSRWRSVMPMCNNLRAHTFDVIKRKCVKRKLIVWLLRWNSS